MLQNLTYNVINLLNFDSHSFQCSSGILNTLPCSMGTAFNPVSGSCDDPMNVPGCTILK